MGHTPYCGWLGSFSWKMEETKKKKKKMKKGLPGGAAESQPLSLAAAIKRSARRRPTATDLRLRFCLGPAGPAVSGHTALSGAGGGCHPVVVVQMDVQRYATRTSGWQLSESPWMSWNITLGENLRARGGHPSSVGGPAPTLLFQGLIFHMISPPPVPRLALGPWAVRDTQPLSSSKFTCDGSESWSTLKKEFTQKCAPVPPMFHLFEPVVRSMVTWCDTWCYP
ncbi:unnamed protein product [Lota lota]